MSREKIFRKYLACRYSLTIIEAGENANEKDGKKGWPEKEIAHTGKTLAAHCTCIAILPGATTSGRLDQSFSTSAHHDIGLPYIHLRLLHPPTFSRLVHLNPSLSRGGSPSVPSWSVGVALDQVKESIRHSYIRILHRSLTTLTRFFSSIDPLFFLSFFFFSLLSWRISWMTFFWY